MKTSELRKCGKILDRDGLALLAMRIAEEIVKDGSYQGAIQGAGKMQAIVRACGFDDYWNEKVHIGIYNGEYDLKKLADAKVEWEAK